MTRAKRARLNNRIRRDPRRMLIWPDGTMVPSEILLLYGSDGRPMLNLPSRKMCRRMVQQREQEKSDAEMFRDYVLGRRSNLDQQGL